MSKRRAGGRGNEDNACSPVVVKYNPGEIEEIQEMLRKKGLRKLRKQIELEESTTQEEAVNMMEETIDLVSDEEVLEHAGGEEVEEVMLIDDEDEFETDKCQAPRYLGHPSGAVDEVKGIRDKRLSLIEDGEEATNS